MAEDRFAHSTDGQEVEQADLNNMSDNAGLADDHVIAEFFRLAPKNGAVVSRAVLPYAVSDLAWINKPIVAPSGSSNAKVTVRPFRAIIGSRTDVGTDVRKAWNDLRSAIALGSTAFSQDVQFDATLASSRVDLLYARVTIDQDSTPVARFVKTPGAAATSVPLSVRKAVAVQLGVVKGAEGVTPARPALPSDADPDYYIPLAYIFLQHPFTSVTAIGKQNIQEVAPVIGLSSGTGGVSLAPASALWDQSVSGGPLGNLDFDPSGRPDFHLPPSMSGGVSRIFVYDPSAMPAGSTVVLDDSIDWRKRLFKTLVQSTATGTFAWTAVASPDLVPSFYAASAHHVQTLGQSFYDDGTAQAGIAGGLACQVTNAMLADMQSGSIIHIVARASDGALVMKVSATAPNARLFFWLDATGAHGNG